MVAEPKHKRHCAHLYDLGQDEPNGWGGLGMPDECRPSVLQGDGGNAVGAAHTPLPLRGTPPNLGGEFCATPPMIRGELLVEAGRVTVHWQSVG